MHLKNVDSSAYIITTNDCHIQIFGSGCGGSKSCCNDNGRFLIVVT